MCEICTGNPWRNIGNIVLHACPILKEQIATNILLCLFDKGNIINVIEEGG